MSEFFRSRSFLNKNTSAVISETLKNKLADAYMLSKNSELGPSNTYLVLSTDELYTLCKYLELDKDFEDKVSYTFKCLCTANNWLLDNVHMEKADRDKYLKKELIYSLAEKISNIITNLYEDNSAGDFLTDYSIELDIAVDKKYVAEK